MVDVISVKFKGRGKVYYFDPNGVEAAAGDKVVVETSKGQELCECVEGPHTVTDERIVPPLRPVVRRATADDLRVAELCRERAKEAFGICERKIAEHQLEMKLVDVECAFDGSKILFFFTADGRVDFRALVKDLAGVFRTRIELRQIGVRDEAKMLGGIGMCGRSFCCSQFLEDFAPVSTKMAKVQSLSLNPTKISGCCGRLMCCLRYEEEAYEELNQTVPKVGAFVETVAGYGNVVQVNLLRQTVKVRLDTPEETRAYPADEVAVIPGGRPRPGEPLPHILEIKPKEPEEPDIEPDEWAAPALFAEDTGPDDPDGAGERGRRAGNRHGKGRGPAGGKKPGEKPERQGQPRPQERGEGGNRPSAPPRRPREKDSREWKPRQQDKNQAPRPSAPRPAPKPDAASTQAGDKKPNPNANRRRHFYGKPRQKPQDNNG